MYQLKILGPHAHLDYQRRAYEHDKRSVFSLIPPYLAKLRECSRIMDFFGSTGRGSGCPDLWLGFRGSSTGWPLRDRAVLWPIYLPSLGFVGHESATHKKVFVAGRPTIFCRRYGLNQRLL